MAFLRRRSVEKDFELSFTLESVELKGKTASKPPKDLMVEIDMPGHNYAFGIGYPELIVNCTAMYPLETEFWCSSFALYRGEAVYDFIEKLLGELTALLPAKLFHIGGDEV